MRAIVYTETGSPSVLTEVERDVVDPAAGEVRVRLIVAGVNPTDWKSRTGAGPGRRPAFDEVVPGQDGAGIVDAVGPEVGGIAVGDRVWLILAQHERPTGTAQEYTVVPADRVALLPDDEDFDLGASLGVPAVTAHRALTVAEDGPRRLHPGALDGTVVLVAGGAGAVGHAAIQLARWSGATVITTVSSSEKAALATAAGAHHVVNYRSDDAAARIREIAPDGVDIIVEVAPAQNAELNLAVASQRATISVYANNGGTAMTIEVRPHMVGNVRYQFLLLYTVGSAALDAAKNDVTEAVRAGALPVGEAHGLPLHRFPLVETARAHEAVESEVVGKVLIDIGTA